MFCAVLSFFVQFLKGCEKLKCKFLNIWLFVCLCLIPTFGSFAESNTSKPMFESGTKDEKGCYTSGTLVCLDESSGYAHRFTLSGSNLYAVIVDGNHYSICGSNVKYTFEYRDSYDKEFIAWENSSFSGSKNVAGKGTLYGSIPVFDKNKEGYEDAVRRYLDNGDTSGCENSKDIVTDNIDGSVEVPHGLKISGEFSFGTIQKVFKNNLLSFGWSIPEMEDLTFDAQFKFNYLDKKQSSENGIDSSWYNWRDNIKYNYDSAAMILDVVSKAKGVNWLASARSSLGLSMDDCYSITFRVRNRKGDKVSNWVEIQLGQDGKATARETDLNGNTQKSDEYNEDTNPSTNDSNPGSNDFYDWVKDKTDNSTNKDSDSTTNGLSSSVSDLKTFITSGFGLLGSNGIIALMSGLFSYIPASVWTLIKSAIAMTILIMLIGLIKNLVFG